MILFFSSPPSLLLFFYLDTIISLDVINLVKGNHFVFSKILVIESHTRDGRQIVLLIVGSTH